MDSSSRASNPDFHHYPPRVVPSPEAAATVSGFRPVLLEVTLGDIVKMDYFFNESPMFDATKKNALAFALQRMVKKGVNASVSMSNGIAMAVIDGKSYSLGYKLGTWMDSFYAGKVVEPIRQTVWLPSEALRYTKPKVGDFFDDEGFDRRSVGA